MEKPVEPWSWICWTIRNILNKMLPWPSKLQFGGGWLQWRSINLQHMMSLLVTGNRLRMILWPSGFLVLALPWMCFMEILFAAKMITSSWTTSSPITYITLILWVLAKKKLGLMNCLVVLNRFLSIHPLPPPWTVEPTCILLIDSPFFLELILFVS